MQKVQTRYRKESETAATRKDGKLAVPPKPVQPPAADRTLTGHVRDPQGRPLVGVLISVVPEGPDAANFAGQRAILAMSDRDGMFLVAGLPRRELSVRARHLDDVLVQKTVAADQDTVDVVYELRSKAAPTPVQDEPIPLALKDRLTFVDLDPHGTDSLAEGPGGAGNDLERLPRGVHALGRTFFRIGQEMIHLSGQAAPDQPKRIAGVPIGARADRVHFLHGTQWAVPPGTTVGAYVVHYADGTEARVPLVYGRDLVNWWRFPASLETPTLAALAWIGSNRAAVETKGLEIRLYALTWANPHPEKAIATLDVESAGTPCDPFVVAVTLERGE